MSLALVSVHAASAQCPDDWPPPCGPQPVAPPSVAALYLERVGVRGASYWSSLRMPEFDPIREHPRFARIVQESRPPGARP